MRASLVADRLYAFSLRPHEWDVHRERAQLSLRYGSLADDPAVPADRHWSLLVIEVRVSLPDADPLAADHPDGLEVLRCGWEGELELPLAMPATALEEDPAEVPTLLARIVTLVNDCAERAGLDELLNEKMVAALLAEYYSP